MSVSVKRWQQLADELEFEQLSGARKQAEGWRTGLAGLTALLASVTVIKGPESISQLADWVRYAVVGLLVLGLALLVAGTMAAVRAAAGRPGASIYLDGGELQEWTLAEAESVQADIVRASRRMLVGLGALALALGLTWLGPDAETGPAQVKIERDGLQACGILVVIDGHTVVIRDSKKPADPPRTIDLDPAVRIQPVEKC